MGSVFGETRRSVFFAFSVTLVCIITILCSDLFNSAVISGIGVLVVFSLTSIRKEEIQDKTKALTKLLCILYVGFILGGFVYANASNIAVPFAIVLSVLYNYTFNEILNGIDNEELTEKEKEILELKTYENRELRNKRSFVNSSFDDNKGYSYTHTYFSNTTLVSSSVKERNKNETLLGLINVVDCKQIDDYLLEYSELKDSKLPVVKEYYSYLQEEYKAFDKYLKTRLNYYTQELKQSELDIEYKNLGKDLQKDLKGYYIQNIDLEIGDIKCSYKVIFVCNRGVFCIGNVSNLIKLLDTRVYDLNSFTVESIKEMEQSLTILNVKEINSTLSQNKLIDDQYYFYDYSSEIADNVEKYNKEIESNKNHLKSLRELNETYNNLATEVNSLQR